MNVQNAVDAKDCFSLTRSRVRLALNTVMQNVRFGLQSMFYSWRVKFVKERHDE